jgi:DNA-binding NarL/FixJ family response regulator
MDIITDMPRPVAFLEADTSRQALDLLRDHTCGLVILDLSLPDESGFETLAGIRRTQPELPVIVSSMHVEAEYARRALALGANGYLGKNAAPGELALAIARVLDGEAYVSPGLAGELTSRDGPAGRPGSPRPHRPDLGIRDGLKTSLTPNPGCSLPWLERFSWVIQPPTLVSLESDRA